MAHSVAFTSLILNNMKLAILLFCLAAYAAAQCDPYSDNKPNCAGRANGERARNFFDPTRFWECKNGEAVAVTCYEAYEDYLGFDPDTLGCIKWSDWTWKRPCPPVVD